MATEVQIALQPQAGQDPAAALAAAAAKLARSSLAQLVQQAGQPLTGKIVPPPANLPSGFSQVAVADMVLTLKLSTPLPAGTPVRIDVQQTPGGQPAVTVQPMPQSAVPAPAPAVQVATPAPLPLPPQASSPAQPVAQQPVTPQQPVPAATPSAASQPQPTLQPITAAPSPQPTPVAQAPLQPPAPAPSQPVPAQPAPVVAAQPAPQAPATVATTTAPTAPVPAAPSGSPAPTPQMPAPQVQTSTPAPAPAAAPQPPAPASAQSVATLPQQATPMPSPSVQPSPPPLVSGATASPTPPQLQASLPQATAPAAQQPAPRAPTPLPTLVQRLTQAFVPPPPVATAPAPPPAPGSPAQLVIAATTQAAAQQQSPAPLLQALAASLPQLPQPVAEAAARVLASRVNLDRGAPTGETLKQAVLKSGIFLDSPAKAGSPPDLRQALGQLRGTLLAWLGDDIAPVAPVGRRPPPPVTRGSMPRAQAPELPPATESGSKEAGKTLLGQTEGSLARIKLMQLGSQPAEAARPGAPAAAAPGEWRLELPMMLGHELAMAQIQIQRDGKGKTEARDKPWRLRFALQFSVLGEVGAQVTMVGPRASIAIWADEEATAETLEGMLPELVPALAAKGLELVSLTVRRGAPRDETQQAGRLMDSTR